MYTCILQLLCHRALCSIHSWIPTNMGSCDASRSSLIPLDSRSLRHGLFADLATYSHLNYPYGVPLGACMVPLTYFIGGVLDGHRQTMIRCSTCFLFGVSIYCAACSNYAHVPLSHRQCCRRRDTERHSRVYGVNGFYGIELIARTPVWICGHVWQDMSIMIIVSSALFMS